MGRPIRDQDTDSGLYCPYENKGLRVKAKGAPTIEKPTVRPGRLTNAAVRPREYLTGEEIRHLLKTARARAGAKFPHRDATMILMAYRHGLRVSELVSMRWDMLDLKQGTFHVVRRKNGRASVHRKRRLRLPTTHIFDQPQGRL